MFLDNLSTSVLRLCDEKHLTYRSASLRCALSPRHFGNIARGQSAPTILTLEKLCIGLETTPNELLLIPEMYHQLSYRQPLAVSHIHQFYCCRGLIGYPVCPKCGNTMEREYQPFCDRCGQCLDWSAYDHATLILPGRYTNTEST